MSLPTSTTIIKSFAELLTYLGEQNVPHAVNTAAQVIEIPTKAPPLEGVVYLRWEKESPYIQIIKPLALNVDPSRIRDLEVALCRVNNGVVLPGFGFDYERRTLYFRLTVPLFPEGIAAINVQRLVLACVQTARDLLPPFRGVLEGKSGDQILQAVLAHKRDQQAAAAASAAAAAQAASATGSTLKD